MRAGYAAFGLGVLLSIGGVLALGAITPTVPGYPVESVNAVLGLDGPDAADLDGRRAAAVAALIARCMAAHGLPYPTAVEAPPAIPDASLDPEAWAARWGFGVSASLGQVSDAADQVAPEDPAAPDPVAAFLAERDPTERARYRDALYGTAPAAGCQPQATETVYGLRPRLLAPLRADLEALEASIEADPAMRPVRDAWTHCASLAVRELALGPEATHRERLPGRLLAWFGARAHAVSDTAARDALFTLERRVAVAVARCEQGFVTARARVAGPHESSFVAAHRAALEAIGAAIRQAEAAYPAPTAR